MQITASASASTITVPSHIDLVVQEGFREGDKILVTGGSMNGRLYRIIWNENKQYCSCYY